MADVALITERVHPLAGRRAAGAGVDIVPAPPAHRTSLRCGTRQAGAVGEALGLTLPKKPKTSANSGGRAALWLGPDEWLVIDEEDDPNADLAGIGALCSAVDVSHRNTAILVSGLAAADCLNAGCAQDLSDQAFPVGAASRTLFGKAEIVLYRPEAETFRVEVWRSFSDYVFAYLTEAARDFR